MSKPARGAAWLAVVIAACGCTVSAPEPGELSKGGSLQATSRLGLAQARLSALGAFAPGTNDFELVISPRSTEGAAVLESFEALMPAHGHRATPLQIERVGDGYQILALPLPMSGMWRLTGNLQIDRAPDEISFDVDVP